MSKGALILLEDFLRFFVDHGELLKHWELLFLECQEIDLNEILRKLETLVVKWSIRVIYVRLKNSLGNFVKRRNFGTKNRERSKGNLK